MKCKHRKSRSLFLRKGKVNQSIHFKVASQKLPTMSEESVKSLGRWFDESLKDINQAKETSRILWGRSLSIKREIQGLGPAAYIYSDVIMAGPDLLPTQPSEKRLRDTDIENKGGEGQPNRSDRSNVKDPERFPFTCFTAWGLCFSMLIQLGSTRGSNPMVSKTVAKNRWSFLSNALYWYKLISVASASSSIPSMTLWMKCRF